MLEIKDWALSEYVPAKTLKSLLLILRKYFKHLPADPRTLLSTPKSTSLRVVEPGVYYHYGLKNNLIDFLNTNLNYNQSNIDVVFNIDGLPLSKSSGSQLWPILGSVMGFKEVFVIGLYHSFFSKPENVNVYLHDFVQESQLLVEDGFMFKSKNYSCSIKMFVADTPAKAFTLCIKHHSGYSSCTKCCTEGEYVERRVCFPDMDSLSRTDASFAEMTDYDYHHGITPLLNIPGFGPVTNVPIDYMHLVCLGVVKKLINLWFHGPMNVRLRSSQEKEISVNIDKIKLYVPIEFQRKPRSLNEYKFWKAVEFRSFLLYIGPVVLKNKIPIDVYNNFLTLHVAIKILCGNGLTEELILYAEQLLKHFVIIFKEIYGVHNLSHNVHGLIHLANDCKMFGPLDNFSAFRFENCMQQLLKLIRKHNYPIQQVVRRLAERNSTILSKNISSTADVVLCTQHNNGPLPLSCHSPQYERITFNGLTLIANNLKNGCCLTQNGSFVIIKNFAYQSKNLCFVGNQFLVRTELYDYPCKSSHFNIYELNDLSTELEVWDIKSIKNKIFLYKSPNGNFAAFPIHHNEFSEK